jgi:hypothetical protein
MVTESSLQNGKAEDWWGRMVALADHSQSFNVEVKNVWSSTSLSVDLSGFEDKNIFKYTRWLKYDRD